MGYLITGIVFFVLPIITWFDASHFVEKLGITLFFWAIGIPMILVGADRLTPRGIWKTKGQGSGGSSGTEYRKIYHYDSKGKETGYTEIPKK